MIETIIPTTNDTVELPPHAAELIRAFESIKTTLKGLEAEKARVELELRRLLMDTEVGTIDGVERIRVVKRNNSKIDRDMLRSAWPEAFEATLILTPYTVLQTK